MSGANLPVGCYVRLDKPELQKIIDALKALGHRVVGPRVSGSAIVYDEIDRLADLPVGYRDEQEAGVYRLHPQSEGRYFDYVVGPHSLKNYLFPPRVTVLECIRNGKGWSSGVPEPAIAPLAILGVRPCDIHALKVQDRVFLEGRFVDGDYERRRRDLFLLAINCGRAASTCFCTSMETGPSATFGFDLALTELPDFFVLEIGSDIGGKVASRAEWTPCSNREVAEAQQIPRKAVREMEQRRQGGAAGGRRLETAGLHDLLLSNLEHERWDQVGERCLACGNCTMVCPTCFCCNVDDVANLSGDHVERVRQWDSCFTAEHSYMNSGTVRRAVRARYRQWLTHKLASWIDQYGCSGCVGCGRCITWCPVGIDLTEEVAAIRGGAS
jgi:ferredoxin